MSIFKPPKLRANIPCQTKANLSMQPIEFQRNQFLISTDPNRLDPTAIHNFLANESYWAKGIQREAVEKAIAHSLCFGLYDAEQQIGFARVISDYATYGYLDDVYVLAPYRGQGLGKWLMACVLAHPQLQTLRRFMLATRHAQAFYNQFGFNALAFPQRHLEKLAPDFYQKIPTD